MQDGNMHPDLFCWRSRGIQHPPSEMYYVWLLFGFAEADIAQGPSSHQHTPERALLWKQRILVSSPNILWKGKFRANFLTVPTKRLIQLWKEPWTALLKIQVSSSRTPVLHGYVFEFRSEKKESSVIPTQARISGTELMPHIGNSEWFWHYMKY